MPNYMYSFFSNLPNYTASFCTVFAFNYQKNSMCEHKYQLEKTRVVRYKTFFSKRQVTTEFYVCKYCGKTTFVKKELMMDKFEVPPLNILEHLN